MASSEQASGARRSYRLVGLAAEESSEELQIFRTAALRDGRVLDRQEKPAGHINSSSLAWPVPARAHRLLDRGGDMKARPGIGARGRGGDAFRIRPLVMGRRADDRIERWRERADDFVRLLVARDAPVTRIQSCGAMDRHEACQRLPDAVGGVTDVDDGERVLTDDLEAAGPARLAQAGAYRGFDPVRSRCAAARAAARAETG